MQKVHRHSYAQHPIKKSDKSIPLRLLVSNEFQDLFHYPCGVLFIFPLRYLFSIGHKKLLDLEGGPPLFNQIKVRSTLRNTI